MDYISALIKRPPKRSLFPPTMWVCNPEKGPNQNLTVLATMISDVQLPEQLEISVVYKPPGLRDPVTAPSWN